MTNELAGIGDNNPPTPFEDAEGRITVLYDEAKLWLDGDEVDSEGSAEGIAKLLNMLRKAGNDAEALRKEEKKPHDDAGKAVQAKFKPLSDRVKLATDACKKALQPWLVKQAAEKQAKEEALRKEAEEAERKEMEAREAAQADDLESQEALAEAEEAADKAKAIATKKRNASGGTKPSFGRAVSLRTSYVPELVDPVAAAEHYWRTKQDRVKELFVQLAKEDIMQGKRAVPGFEIREVKSAV